MTHSCPTRRSAELRLGDKNVECRVIPFSGLLPALLAKQCDMIVDQLFDKPERREVIDIVNYMYSSQAVVVPKGNPKTLKTLSDLSGHKVRSEEHTSELQ